jgi:hypothetical protein
MTTKNFRVKQGLEVAGSATLDGDLAVNGGDITGPGGNTLNIGVGGPVKLSGASYQTTVNGTLLTPSIEDVPNGGSIDLTKSASYFSLSGAETATMGVGTAGQFKSLMCYFKFAPSDSMVITVTGAAWGGAGTITFDTVGDACLLHFVFGKWYAVGVNGVTFA